MTMKRAYSVLEVKGITEDDDYFHVEGIASTPTPDRMGDIVEPMGAKFQLPMPLLWQHNHQSPVGHVDFAQPNKKGIPFKATIPKVKEPGNLKDRIDEAIQSVKYKLVMAVSIGFNVIEGAYERMANGGYRFKEWEWLELSLVTIPANADATITSIKSIDREILTALGRKDELEDDKPVPSVVGKSKLSKPVILTKGTPMKTLLEMIADFKAKKVELEGKIDALVNKSVEEGRTFDPSEAEEHDEYVAEIKGIDEHITRLEARQKAQLENATVVTNVATEQEGVQVRSASSIQVVTNLPKGTGFTRYVMALTRAKGNPFEAAQYAKRWSDSTPQVEAVLKAAADAGTTTDADWASKLVAYDTLASEFVELLRPMTILGKFGAAGIPSLRRVPFNVRMATQTGGGTYKWVGEGAPKPVGELAIGEITLKWAKAAGIIVVTDELMRMSNPSVEAVVRQDMLTGMAQFSDSQFIDPTIAAVSDVSPASILNGVTPVTPTGTDADAFRIDAGTLLNKFFTANLAPTTGVWIMSNRQAVRLSMMRNALGQREFPDMTALGGTLEGFPVIASEAVPDGSDGGIIAFVNANDVYFSDDGPVTIDASREASLQMNTTPDNPTSASTVLVSLWQNNMVALRAERYMNWKKRRSAAAQFIESANYGTT